MGERGGQGFIAVYEHVDGHCAVQHCGTYMVHHREERGTQTELGWLAGYDGRLLAAGRFPQVAAGVNYHVGRARAGRVKGKEDGCPGRSELHDIASRDIAPSDESVLKRILDPQVRLTLSWLSTLLCAAAFQFRQTRALTSRGGRVAGA